MSDLDLRDLKKAEGRKFLSALEVAEESLTRKDAKQFFKIVLNHFQDEIKPSTGKAILKTVDTLLNDSKILTVFVDNQFISMLPFDQKPYGSEICDILLTLASSAPEVFDEEITEQIIPSLKKSPEKALTVLATYVQNIDDVDDSRPMLRLILKLSRNFQESEGTCDYISLLSFACRNSDDFKRSSAEKCWNILISYLDSEDGEVIKCAYRGLSCIADVVEMNELPYEQIKRHLKHSSYRSSILALLLVDPPSGKEGKDKRLLDTLISMANSDVKALYVLLQTVADKNIAKYFIQNDDWMRSSLPTEGDTFRLLLALFQHKSLRQSIAESQYFLKFLKKICNMTKESPVITIICTLFRRIELSKQYIGEMSSSGFLEAFFQATADIADDYALHSALLLVDTISAVCCTDELISMCEIILDLAKSNGPLSFVAAQVAVDIARHPKCLNKLLKYKADAFFKKKKNDTKYSKIARTFFKYMENLDNGDDDEDEDNSEDIGRNNRHSPHKRRR